MMSMLNQAAVEALCSATYLENYLNCMDNLPDDVQRVVSQLRELDVLLNDVLADIQTHQEIYIREADGNKRQRSLVQIQRGLIRSQEIEDEKLQLVSQVIEHIDSRARQLEQDLENLDPSAAAGLIEETKTKAVNSSINTSQQSSSRSSKASEANNTPVLIKTEEKCEVTPVSAKNKRSRRGQRTQAEIAKEEKQKDEDEQRQPLRKKKKRKVKQQKGGADKSGDRSPLDFHDIDPDEPTYCLCDQVSYGEMIGCDNDACQIEWFHFNCVQLVHKPKGKWYCPNCRGDKPTVKRHDLK